MLRHTRKLISVTVEFEYIIFHSCGFDKYCAGASANYYCNASILLCAKQKLNNKIVFSIWQRLRTETNGKNVDVIQRRGRANRKSFSLQ